MAEKCTNTSSPVERWINPYPFAPLNHFTVPFSLTDKTPFTHREEYVPQSLGFCFDSTEAPLKESRRTVGCVSMCGGKLIPKRKRPRCSRGQSMPAAGTSGVRQFGALFHYTQQTSTTIGLTTGPLSGIEQQIISSIKTFRNIN